MKAVWRRISRAAGAALLGALMASHPGSAEVSTTRLPDEQRVGDESHPKILAQFGGIYEDADLTAYVDSVGRKLVSVSHQPNAKWTFSILDSPVVNAFATPGGYVYVTRGLLALANDEAELAGVLGHEIGHVVAQHGAARQEQSTLGGLGVIGGLIIGGILGGKDGAEIGARIGKLGAGLYVTKHSREHELEADRLGVRYLAAAGYDPYAQADFLDNMAEEATLQARIAGKDHNPNRVSFFASHPATGDRVRVAIEAAKGTGLDLSDLRRGRSTYLKQIDGLIYGDSHEEGFVRGQNFLHPVLRFTFTAPQGYTIVNGTRAIRVNGPNDALLVMDGDVYSGGEMATYLARVWVPQIRKNTRTGDLGRITKTTIGSLPAAEATMRVETRNGPKDASLTVIRLGDRLYRFAALVSPGDRAARRLLTATVDGFRELTKREAASLSTLSIRIRKVRRGESVDDLAARLPFDRLRRDRFATLNGLDDRTLETGSAYKTIMK